MNKTPMPKLKIKQIKQNVWKFLSYPRGYKSWEDIMLIRFRPEHLDWEVIICFPFTHEKGIAHRVMQLKKAEKAIKILKKNYKLKKLPINS